MLGTSRVPYAAAEQGQFFRIFARLHPTAHFPSFAVLYVGIASAFCCLWQLDQLIQAAIVISVLTQSIPTVIAVVALRTRQPNIDQRFRMWLYPLPIAIALAGWIYIIATSGAIYALAAFSVLILGIVAYLWRAREAREWPWAA
jgi:amino acid transporter